MKILKWFLIVISVLLPAAVIAGVIFIRSFNINSYKPLIEKTVTEALGRDFKINGEIKMALALSPTIVVDNVTLANAPFGTAKDMASVKQLSVKFSLLDLLKGSVKADNIEVDSLYVLLETDRKRNPNWDFAPVDSAKPSESTDIAKEVSDLGFKLSYAFGDILLKDAKIVYRNGTNDQKITVDLPRVHMNADGGFSLSGTVNGKALSIDGQSADISGILNGVKEFPINLQIVYAANTVKVKGLIKDIEALSGIDIAVSAEGKEIPVLGAYKAEMLLTGSAKALGVKDIELTAGSPDKFFVNAKGKIDNVETMAGTKITMTADAVNAEMLGVKPFTLKVDVNEVKGMSAVDTVINFKAGESIVTGSVKVDISGKKPDIIANLLSPLFRLDDILPDSAYAKNASNVGESQTKNKDDEESILTFSDEPLPWIRLGDANVKANATFNKIVLPEVSQSLTGTADILLSNSILKLAMTNSSDANDSLQTNLYIDASALDTADVDLKIKGQNIVLGQLLYKLLQGKVQGATTDIDMNLKTKGDSLHILMSNLDGYVTLVIENAKLESSPVSWLGSDALIKLADMVKGIIKRKNEKQDNVQCLVANFKVKDGKTALNKGVAMETDAAFVVLDGNVDFGNERMNLTMRTSSPDALNTGVTNLLTGLIKIDGSFSEPTIGIDSKGVVGAAATVGAALMTGGISYLGQHLVSTTLADSSPCATALGRPVPASKAYQKAKKAEASQKTQASKPSEKQNPKAKKKNNPVDAMKSLFNNGAKPNKTKPIRIDE